MMEAVPTEEEVREFVQQYWVDKTLTHAEMSNFVSRCRNTPAMALLWELRAPYSKAIADDLAHRKAIWYASPVPEQLRVELRKYTSDEDLIQELIDVTSWTGAAYVGEEYKVPPIFGWVRSLWHMRGEGDLKTVLEFAALEDDLR